MTLADRTLSVLDDLPPYLAGDLAVQGTLDPLMREIDRLEAAMAGMRDKLMPQNADDEYRTLGMWETLIGLPVEPSGATLAQRRALVLSHLRSRLSGASSDWVAVATEILGSVWTWQLGPGPNAITVHISHSEEQLTAGQAATLLRAITPAHVDLIVTYGEGFLVGISEIGVETL